MDESYNFIVKKSAWRALTWKRVLFIWTIIPIFIIICHIIMLKKDNIYFYEDRIIEKSGVFSKNETEMTFVGISAISIHQSLLGRIFKFGDVLVDVVGKWNIDTRGVKNPRAVKEFLSQYIVKSENVTRIINA